MAHPSSASGYVGSPRWWGSVESLEHILQGRTIPAPYDGNDEDDDDDGENVVPGIEGHTDVGFCVVVFG